MFKERVSYYEARQQIGEDIGAWHVRVMALAVNCNFGGHLKEES